MNEIDLGIARHHAERELHDELFREAVQREKALLRTRKNTSFWQRLISKLPFTITWKKP